MNAVTVNNLCMSYGGTTALRSLSFEVAQGEIFGIIGADGAGKTTLFRILTTLMLPDSGEAAVDGMDVVRDFRAIRQSIGYMPGKFSLYADLTVEENLTFFATVFNTTIAENYDLIADIYKQIEPFKDRRAGKLSGGMKQKLALSCALIHKPRVLFLDEPTTGVDPVSRKEFWEMLFKLRAQGITILVSTPYMDEATRCDRIALMQEGEFMQIATPEQVVEQYPETLWAVRSAAMPRLLGDLRAYCATKTAFSFGETIHVTMHPGGDADALRGYLTAEGHDKVEIGVIRPTVEDCFMLLSKKE